jgi:hypothetical protein
MSSYAPKRGRMKHTLWLLIVYFLSATSHSYGQPAAPTVIPPPPPTQPLSPQPPPAPHGPPPPPAVPTASTTKPESSSDECRSYDKEIAKDESGKPITGRDGKPVYKEGRNIGDLGDNWSVGTKATLALFRYNLASERASFNEKSAGVGLSFRYYSDDQLNSIGHTSIKNVPQACRARTEDLLDFFRPTKAGLLPKIGSWISLSPTLFVSKAENESDVSLQPAIIVGLFNDILSIGTSYNLTGTGKGQWSLLIGPSYGFQW